MGNQITTRTCNNHSFSSHYKNKPHQNTKIFKSLKQKLHKIKVHKASSPQQTNSDSIDSITAEKRVVFVSLIGLYQCWQNVPSRVLNPSILLLPMKRQWIYKPKKYYKEMTAHLTNKLPIFCDSYEIHKFFEFLRYKDRQGLVCWMMEYIHQDLHPIYGRSNHKKLPNYSELIASFWYDLSNKLTHLNYKPLRLDTSWWRTDDLNIKYNAKVSSVLTELYFLTMKYHTMQEIIYQSNPGVLDPVYTYQNEWNDDHEPQQITPITDSGILHLYDTEHSNSEADDVDEDNTWFISDDYDPFDLSC